MPTNIEFDYNHIVRPEPDVINKYSENPMISSNNFHKYRKGKFGK